MNIRDQTREPLITSIYVPGYNTPTGTKVNIPSHPIEWYANTNIPGFYTIYFHIIVNNLDVDTIDFTFRLTADEVILPYKCPFCPAAFETQNELDNHIKTHDNDDEENKWWIIGAVAGLGAALLAGGLWILKKK